MGSREQKTSKVLQEKALTLRANRIRKSLDYTKVENPLYVGEMRQSAREEKVVHLKSVMNHKERSLRSIGDKDEGLVKHMRNLPGYLQRVEKGENIQGKALNFGVLDWGRLENWKSNEKRIPPRYNMKTSVSTNNSTLVETGSAKFSRNRKTIHPPRKNQQASNGVPLSSSCGERPPPGVRWPRGKPVKLQCSESSPGRMLDGTQTPCLKDPSGNKYHMVEPDNTKGKQADQMTSEKETSLDWRKRGSCRSPHYTRRPQASATKVLSDDNINHADAPCPSGSHNAVPSSSGDFPRTDASHDRWLSPDSRNSHDGYLIEANETRLSNCFSPGEFHSLSPFSDVPHSCPFPLPLSAGTDGEPACCNETTVTPLRGRSLEENKLMVRNLSSGKASKKCDLDIEEQPSLKGRQSSPNRRFSFSLGKMTRSFSFKESSAIPQLSSKYTSVKSGPVKFESSLDMDSHKWKQGNTTNPSRSSPLRRLLDPLLKLKGAHLSEKVQKSKMDLEDSTSVALIKKNELLQSKKHGPSNVQALLQLTLKNGIPFFKLVVESSSDILAAAVKKLPSGKDDSSLIYAFYSVHENKKKSGGWISQGSKEKSYRFGYNIVGQMKISSSYHAEFSGPEKDLYVVRESVLYSTDTVQADEKPLDGNGMLDGELSAIIVKNQSDKTCGDIGGSKSMVVVIPDGVHSLPNCGLPSPLIDRWRSGGACDCGGWDIGCQFHILSNRNDMVKTPTPSTSNRLDLCYQGWRRSKNSFSLVSLEDGLYSLEYDPSMSLLQAFSICVAVVSSQKLTHIFQVNYVPGSKHKHALTKAGKSMEEIPGKYVSKPPASPVGRV